MCGAMTALPPGAGAADAPYGIASEADYAAAFDRESQGVFSRALAAADPGTAIASYRAIVRAFSKIEDALYEAHSPHANHMPAWYAQRLAEMGFGQLQDASFLIGELSSGDFDRVVHGYWLAGLGHLPLLAGDLPDPLSPQPTPLWQKMVAVARGDAEDRYWISLAIAEARMLSHSQWDTQRTKMASSYESVRERIGRNADFLGPRIVRVLGVADLDPRIAHPRIGYAAEAARRRVREHEIARLGPDAAYRKIRDELANMETGGFESKRFVALMREDLPFLHTRFGAPPDARSLLETLRVLCRGPGQNRMSLWSAADAVAKLYEPAIAARTAAEQPAPLPGAREIVAMGDGASGWLTRTLEDEDRPEGILHVFAEDAIPQVVAEHPPADAVAFRQTIRDAYYAVGYPPALRDAYLRALESLGPEESAHAAASRQALAALRESFARAGDAAAFGAAFDDFRRASGAGRVPARDVDPGFLEAFATSAIRVLEAEQRATREAERRAEAARAAGVAAAAAIEQAEAAVAEANRAIRDANERAPELETSQQQAMEARNAAVEELNRAVERANAAGRGPDAEAARAEARRLERELGARIERHEGEFHAAGRALEEMEERAAGEIARARREQARAEAEARREDEALEQERRARTDAEKSRARFDEVLHRLIAGLGFAGVEGDPAAVGDTGADPNVRLAGLARMLASDAGEAARDAALREEQSGDARLGKLAALVLQNH